MSKAVNPPYCSALSCLPHKPRKKAVASPLPALALAPAPAPASAPASDGREALWKESVYER